jgi:hypothetical protein
MKNILVLSLILTLAQHGRSQSTDEIYMFSYFKNNGQDGLHLAYSFDGLTWKALKGDSSFLTPTVSKDKLMRDPCIIRGADGKFHMVWTVSWNDKGIGYASSRNLTDWSEQQFIPVMSHEDSARNCWAPEIIYDEKKKEYMIFWATTIAGRLKEGESTGDDKYNHRIYYTITRDFKTFSKAKILYDKGFNVIDATIIKKGKEYIMFLKDETRNPPQKNIRIATSKNLTSGYSIPSIPITGKYWAEGPTVLHTPKKWIVYFDKYTEHKYGAMESADLAIWNDISDYLVMPPGIRHGTVFTITKAEFNVLSKH